MQRRWVRVTLRALCGLILAGSGAVAATPTPVAYAVDPVSPVSITLTSIKPGLPDRGSTIQLRGKVTNLSDRPLLRPQAYFWRNQTPIVDRAGVDQALVSAPTDPLGARLADQFGEQFQNLFAEGKPTLDPGQSAKFTVSAAVADLQLAPTDGIYLMGVHVLENGVAPAIGRARIFVPVLAAPPPHTLQASSVVTLSSRPSLIRRNLLSDDHLAAEVAPKGRLTRMLTAAEGEEMSFAVDPALLEELEVMKAGYRVLTAEGDQAGSGAADAGRWLDRFGDLEDDHDGYRLLYGSPDLAALVHSKQKAAIAAAATASAAYEETKDLPLLVLPTDGAADRATVKAAEDLDPAAILLADTATTPGLPLLAGPGTAPIVAFNTAVTGGGPGPEPSTTGVHLQQRMLTDTWLEATATDQTTHGRVRLISTPEQAAGSDRSVAAPWIRPSPLRVLLRSTPASWDGKFHYTDEQRAAELSPDQLDQLRAFGSSQRAYSDLLVDPGAARTGAPPALARAASGAWRRQGGPESAWLGPQQAELDKILRDGVEINSTLQVSTADQQGVVFPITVKNNLAASDDDPTANAVKLRLVFESGNSQRLSIKPIALDDPPIRAQDNRTEEAEVTAKANGTVTVTAYLETMSHQRVGRPATIEVNVTQNGTTGIGIAVIAGVVFIGATALRIRKVTRERAAAASEPAPVDSPLASAPPVDVAAGRAGPTGESFDA